MSPKGCKPGLVGNELDSQSKGCWFESRLIQNTRWKWCNLVQEERKIKAANGAQQKKH